MEKHGGHSIIQGKAAPPLISSWLLLFLLGFSQFSENVYSPALPDIADSLRASSHLVQWTLSAYLFSFALGVLVWGRISDHWGRRPSMLAGLGLCLLGSVLCLVAPNIQWLLLARFIQGFGGAVGSVLSQTMAREALHEERRHRYFSSIGVTIATSLALGPLVGGYLTNLFHWRANFFLLVILNALLLVLSTARLPETLTERKVHRTKLIDVLRTLLMDKHVLACAFLVIMANGILFSYYVEAPFIFIRLLHFSEKQYGWLGTGIALATLLGSVCGRALVKRHSTKRIIGMGCLIMLVSSGLLIAAASSGAASADHPVRAAALIMLPMMGLIFGGWGFVLPMSMSIALEKYQHVLGTAGAVFGLLYCSGIALLAWIMGLLHSGTLLPMPVYFFSLSVLGALTFWYLMKEQVPKELNEPLKANE